jgi:hypothetical protein
MNIRGTFLRYGSQATVCYFVLWTIAALIHSRANLQAGLGAPLVMLSAPMFLSLGLHALLTGEGGGTFTTRRDKNPISFWLLVVTQLVLGGFLLIFGIRAMVTK